MVCGKGAPQVRLVAAHSLGPDLADLIRELHPDRWDPNGAVCMPELNRWRVQYALRRLGKERGELTEVETEIARKASAHELVAQHIGDVFQRQATRGQRVADRVAAVGGSWLFVGSFMGFLALWMALNIWLGRGSFDPYPYILLNLVLSCLAAIQAPVIMMSQNRTTERDRAQAEEDFRVNLKAEMEVASLHEKLDHLLHDQWERLIELQELQLDILAEISEAER